MPIVPNSGYSSKISCTSINSSAQAYRTFSKNSKPDDLFAEHPSFLHYTLGYLFKKKTRPCGLYNVKKVKNVNIVYLITSIYFLLTNDFDETDDFFFLSLYCFVYLNIWLNLIIIIFFLIPRQRDFFFSKVDNMKKALMYCFIPFRKPSYRPSTKPQR